MNKYTVACGDSIETLIIAANTLLEQGNYKPVGSIVVDRQNARCRPTYIQSFALLENH